MTSRKLEIRGNLQTAYEDVLTKEVVTAIEELAPLDDDRMRVMGSRIDRRTARARKKQRIEFLDADAFIPGTRIKVQDARDGVFTGSEIPSDLQRQWIQGTGPAARPDVPTRTSIRNIAYALLSGADGWMFDGEDALGQVSTMSLDNQRNLDHRRLEDAARLHDEDLPPARPSPRRPSRPSCRRRRLLGIDRRHRAVRRQ
jgi:malate synthase